MTITWKGQAIKAEAKSAGVRGLQKAGEHLLGVSRERVPHEEGTLQDTGTVSMDEGAGEVAVSYDGPYAVIQHEMLDWRHDEGRTAKYLENPAHEESTTMLDMVAAEIRRAVR